jgi:hypothetical protein
MRGFLNKATRLTPIAAGAAAAMVVLGIVAIIGGNYANQVVHEQLGPQKIFFPKPAEYPDLTQYAGQQVLTGSQAKVFANDQIAPDLNKVFNGLTYSQLTYSIKNPLVASGVNTTLVRDRATLFTGETLRGLLLNAWGWAQLGSIAVIAGILLIVFGAILFLLPVLNWQLNLRGQPEGSDSPQGPPSPADSATVT